MSVVDGGSASSLIQRVQDILLRPKPTWDVIEGEQATVQGLYTGYICILAAIIPVLSLLWTVLISPLFGMGAPFFLVGAIVNTVVSYIVGLAGVYVFAWIADQLAANFGATRNFIQGFKVAAYGMTAAWVSGLFLIIPFVGIIGVVAGCIYTIYLIHLGVVRLLKPAEDKAILYSAVCIVATGLVMGLANMIVARLT